MQIVGLSDGSLQEEIFGLGPFFEQSRAPPDQNDQDKPETTKKRHSKQEQAENTAPFPVEFFNVQARSGGGE